MKFYPYDEIIKITTKYKIKGLDVYELNEETSEYEKANLSQSEYEQILFAFKLRYEIDEKYNAQNGGNQNIDDINSLLQKLLTYPNIMKTNIHEAINSITNGREAFRQSLVPTKGKYKKETRNEPLTQIKLERMRQFVRKLISYYDKIESNYMYMQRIHGEEDRMKSIVQAIKTQEYHMPEDIYAFIQILKAADNLNIEGDTKDYVTQFIKVGTVASGIEKLMQSREVMQIKKMAEKSEETKKKQTIAEIDKNNAGLYLQERLKKSSLEDVYREAYKILYGNEIGKMREKVKIKISDKDGVIAAEDMRKISFLRVLMRRAGNAPSISTQTEESITIETDKFRDKVC